METTIKSIRNDLRLSMNGIASTSMREKGVHYRMNFGVDLMRIREISSRYTPDQVLAEMLWKEDVRELKILATLLYPVDQLTPEAAERWVVNITNQEIREQACRNLFQQIPFAGELVNVWSVSETEEIRATGYWLFARLCITQAPSLGKVESEQILERAVGDLKSESMLLRQAALNVLKYHGRLLTKNREDVLLKVASFNDSTDPYEQEILEQLRFEFGLFD